MGGKQEAEVVMSTSIEFTIRGQSYSLKNARDIFPIKAENGVKCPHCDGRLRMITVPNEKAKAFERDFKRQLPPAAAQALEAAVAVEIRIHYPSNLQDLDEALVLDLCQRYGVIKNDRQVVSKFVEKLIDPENPRVAVKITPVSWERSGLQPSLLDDRPVKPGKPGGAQCLRTYQRPEAGRDFRR